MKKGIMSSYLKASTVFRMNFMISLLSVAGILEPVFCAPRIFTRTWEMSFTVAENENSRVGSKPSAHVEPDETLSLSRASLPPF
jgi:hypothetical protein